MRGYDILMVKKRMTGSVSKIEEEKRVVSIMIDLYCAKNHASEDSLCADCEALLQYAYERLDRCRFGEKKPSCGKCKIHCYKPDMRNRIVSVMRFSGPRMVLTHPILALKHLMSVLKT